MSEIIFLWCHQNSSSVKKTLKTSIFRQEKWLHCPRAFPGRSKAYLYEVIMPFLQGVSKCFHEGLRYLMIKY